MEIYELPGHLIRRLQQTSAHVFQSRVREAGLDITPVQFAALSAIIECPGIDQATIAAKIAYDRATIGGVIDRLEQKTWISRAVSKRDRRAREVRATARGSEIHTLALPVIRDLQSEILTALSADEQRVFLELAKKAAGFLPDQSQ